ncbi:MAG TPA: HNH endonuclease [Anaerolineaceae bacterium]|nr:HNH endonuclease [Anaerolineaceae bacterium]
MAITEKTRKILWAHSGNRCAICRLELTIDASKVSDEVIIGEECHIVAHENNGPRGNSPLSSNDRDKPSNLILLCRNHHKSIDDQPDIYTVDVLTRIKKEHEAWVRSRLSNTRQASTPTFFVFRVDTGTQFCNSVMVGQALMIQNDPPKTQEQADLIGDFVQSFQDYSDIWIDIGGKDRILAQFELDTFIRKLNEIGFLVYVAERSEIFKSPPGQEPMNISVGYIIVLSKENPIVRRKDNKIELLMQLIEQNDSEFTNFIPVICNPSSVSFI